MLATIPAFCAGLQYFSHDSPELAYLSSRACLSTKVAGVTNSEDPAAIYQTMLVADALRYLTLHITGAKSSGHPGGFASSADMYAALVMLGHINIVTEVGHHAPGFYSAMFLDTSLEDMGIHTVTQMAERYREMHGLLGHLSGAIPGLLSPAGPLGQGQHFAMAGAFLHRQTLFPVTIGDGGIGEPYVMSSIQHFHAAFPKVTNFLPILIWNGYSQEHHSMVSTWDNERMLDYWHSHGVQHVYLVNAKDFDDQDQPGDFVDSTQFSLGKRLEFMGFMLKAAEVAASNALNGELTAIIVKQLKGAGVHARGAKSHNLYAHHTLESPEIKDALQRLSLSPQAWVVVRENMQFAGGGPAAKKAVTESEFPLIDLGPLPLIDFTVGESQVPTTAFGEIAKEVGLRDPLFVVTNADGNEASGMANINKGLVIRHPTPDELYFQGPEGQVYEPLSEDACAGFAAALALFGSRSLWCSYESFVINGLPIWQTVTQAMAELRRKTPSTITLFTAGALEQGRNGWTHQRPEVEAYFAAMMRNGNVFPVFPVDANMIQAAYEWALSTFNKGIVITASKSPLQVRVSLAQSKVAIEEGAITLLDSAGKNTIVFAVVGDMILLPVFAAAATLQARGYGVRIVAVVNPRRLYRPEDVAWESCAQPDGRFMSDARFREIFSGDVLIGISGGPGVILEPVMLRNIAKKYDLICWKRGDTAANPGQLFSFNGMNSEAIVKKVLHLL